MRPRNMDQPSGNQVLCHRIRNSQQQIWDPQQLLGREELAPEPARILISSVVRAHR